ERSGVAGTERLAAQRDVVRQVVVALPEEVRSDRAHAWVDDPADAFAVAGVHVVAAAAVAPLAGGHATQERDVLHLLGNLRQVLAHLDAGDARADRLEAAGAVGRLRIESVNMAGSAGHEQQDAALVALLPVGLGLLCGASGERV